MSETACVAIGGSWGAIDALSAICRDLPRDFPAALLVVVHTGRTERSGLAQMLAGGSGLPVEVAEDGVPLAPGRIVIAPAEHHLLVVDDTVRLGRGPRENLSRPAIDPLLRSVGVNSGGNAVGVVLSGLLSDGAAGLADLKRCGGCTVVQDPADAAAADMPLAALRASDIDHRAPASGLAALIDRLARRDLQPRAPAPAEILLEVDIALGRPGIGDALKGFAGPTELTCPACGGVMSQINGEPLRFRCQVGHAYSAAALAGEQEGSVDEAIRVALRIVEERAVLTEKMAQEARAQGRHAAAASFGIRAAEYRQQSELLRQSAMAGFENRRPVAQQNANILS